MNEREKVIKAFEFCLMPPSREELENDICSHEDCPYYREYNGGKCVSAVAADALALLKAQEHIEARLHLCESCAKEYPECDAAIDGIEFGCGVGNDNIIGCTAYDNRWKAQAPVEPTIGGDADGLCGNWWYQCGKCKEAIDYHDKYCRNCGQAVKWE